MQCTAECNYYFHWTFYFNETGKKSSHILVIYQEHRIVSEATENNDIDNKIQWY